MRFVCCLLAAAATAVQVLAASPEPLFRPAPTIPESRSLTREGTPGDRLVLVRLEVLSRGEPVLLNLMPGVSHIALFDRAEERSRGGATWHGRIPAAAPGRAVLVIRDDRVTGVVRAGGSVFRIAPAADGLHMVSRAVVESLPPEAPPLEPDGAGAPEAAPPPPGGGAVESGEIIDVLVVYTRSAARASPDIRAEIQLAVDEANLAYADSGIRQRIRLAGAVQVGYRETGDTVTDLRQVTLADGVLDEVHALRDAACADLVSLWVETGGACGSAWHLVANPILFAPYGYSVVRRDCATSNLSFVHELGHNMGSLHDRFDTPSNNRFPAGHGLVNLDPVDVKRWRTIMALNAECVQTAGTVCPRLPRFTNPEIKLRSDATGVPNGDPLAADNALTFNATAPLVAGLRNSIFCGAPREIDCEPRITEIWNPGGSRVAHLRDRTPRAGRHESFVAVSATLQEARPGSCPEGTSFPAEISLSVAGPGGRIFPDAGAQVILEVSLSAGRTAEALFQPVVYTLDDCARPGEEPGAVSISASATIMEGDDAGDRHAHIVWREIDCLPPGLREPRRGEPDGGATERPPLPSRPRGRTPVGAGDPPMAP